MKKRTEILAKAHLLDSNELAKEYYIEVGLSFKGISDTDYELLSEMIQKEIDILLADKSYQMIKSLRISKIKATKAYVSLRIEGMVRILKAEGSYFKSREGITLHAEDELIVTFCCEMSGCNRIPFITGFVNWVDKLKGE